MTRKRNPNALPAAATLGALGGARGTPAQKRAARRNGKLGGRPKGAKDSAPRKRKPHA